MKHILVTIVACLSLLTALGSSSAHLEPAGFGPFEEGETALRYSRISDLLRLDDDVKGFRFMLLCINDDGRAVLKIVREDADSNWTVVVRETTVSVDSANSKDVVERKLTMDADTGKKIYSEVVSALREVAYSSPHSPKESAAFYTGGMETFVAARPENTFLAGRTWNPPAGSKPYRIQEIAMKLGL